MNIDKEWENFISSSYNDDISDDDEEEINNNILKILKPRAYLLFVRTSSFEFFIVTN